MMDNKIINYLYPLLLVSGILTGWLSQLGIEFLVVVMLMFLTLYSIYSYPFKNKDLTWIISLLLIFSLVLFMAVGSESVVGLRSKLFQLIVTTLFFMCGLNCLRNSNLEKMCNIGIVYISMVVAVYAYIFWFVAGGDLSLFKVMSVQGDDRVISDYLLLATITYPLLFLKCFKGKKDAYLILIILSSLFCLSLGGRGPFIFLIMIVAIVIAKDLKRNLGFMFFSIVVSALLFFYTSVFDVVISRFESISNGDISLDIRFNEYALALESISNNIMLGTGTGSSGLVLGYGDVYAYPHNVILESWLELGVLGVILTSILYIIFSVHCVLCSKIKPEFWVGLVCLFYLINALKSGSIYEQRYLGFYIGIFVYLRTNEYKQHDKF